MCAFEVRTQTLKHAEQSDQIDQHFLGKTILLSWGPRRNCASRPPHGRGWDVCSQSCFLRTART